MATHLVTGGNGFIGAALVKELLAAQHQVRVLDDLSRGHPRRLENVADKVQMLEGDVRNPEDLRHATKGCETVWHLAFINGTRFFYERPDDVLEVGIKGTCNAIEAALAANAKRFVFASTSETYNQPTHVPTAETERLIIPDITNPRFSYGGGKLAGELLTLHYAARRGLETIIVRPHNIYGPDMGFEHIIPEITARIFDLAGGEKGGRVKLPIQGDGGETRAFCHIADAAPGVRLAGEQGTSGEIYHLGCQEETAISALIETIGQVLDVELELVPGPLRPGSTPRRCPDISKLSALGYHPGVTLQEGLRKTVEWYWGWYREHGIEESPHLKP